MTKPCNRYSKTVASGLMDLFVKYLFYDFIVNCSNEAVRYSKVQEAAVTSLLLISANFNRFDEHSFHSLPTTTSTTDKVNSLYFKPHPDFLSECESKVGL